jgi:hypothetical protein
MTYGCCNNTRMLYEDVMSTGQSMVINSDVKFQNLGVYKINIKVPQIS